MNPKYPQHIPFIYGATPLEKLDRLTKFLHGPEIYIKRDDLTGLAGGGNKTRKLQYLVAEAIAQGCDHLVTMGASQSNHCRQTAAAAARQGLGCSLILRGSEPTHINGNLLLDQLFGAHIYWSEDRAPQKLLDEVTRQLVSMGRKPYVIPYGGSNVVGATAYVQVMHELTEQLEAQNINIDAIVHASSSGGTQAGLVLGAEIYHFRGSIWGISVDRPENELKMQVGALATATATHLGLGTLNVTQRVHINDDYIEPGYGVVTDLEREAIQLVAQKEGILLDPVYTGRAMGALIDLIRWGAFTRQQSILFWHTGGMPALFAYADSLL